MFTQCLINYNKQFLWYKIVIIEQDWKKGKISNTMKYILGKAVNVIDGWKLLLGERQMN